MPKLRDFELNKPYVAEAKNQLKTYREDMYPGESAYIGAIADAQIIELMADYAAAIWQEGYDDGHADGMDEGYEQGRQDAEMEQ